MKLSYSFFMALLVLVLISFSPISRAACTPAPDPDLDNNGSVTWTDIGIVMRSNGHSTGQPLYNPVADINCDNKVDVADIQFIKKAFGQIFPIGPKTSIEMIRMSSGGQFKIDNLEGITLIATLKI